MYAARAPRPRPRPGRLQAWRRRLDLARFALWAFAMGALIAPALHLVAHQDDHVHGRFGELLRKELHDHGDGRPHAHAPASDPDGPVVRTDLRTDTGGAHGAGDAWHFGRALLDAGPALPPLAPAPTGPLVAAPNPRAPTLIARPRPASPRGPPRFAPA